MGTRTLRRLPARVEPQSIFEYEGVQYTEIGLILPPIGGLPFEACDRSLHTLNSVKNGIEFCIGDLLNYMEASWGEMYTQAQEVTGLTYSTLSGYKWVSSLISMKDRRAGVDFSKHEAVANLAKTHPDIAFEILDRALEENLRLREVRFDVKQARQDLLMEPQPTPKEFIMPFMRHDYVAAVDRREAEMYDLGGETDVLPTGEIEASVEWLQDLFDLVLTMGTSEPLLPDLLIVRSRAVHWLQNHQVI